jgi:hypothetical protein
MEKNHVNKLIIIGNGFDLALGLKTKYEDFILWILKDALLKALNKGEDRVSLDNYLRRI